jgi:hypothetical protein
MSFNFALICKLKSQLVELNTEIFRLIVSPAAWAPLPEEPKPSIQSTYLAIYEISPAPLEPGSPATVYLFPCP